MKIVDFIKDRIKGDVGLSGTTHALSATAFFLLMVALIPEIIFDKILETRDITTLVLATLLCTGASLFPDIDNTSSIVINQMGVFGKAISSILRGFAVFIHKIIKTKRDNVEADPHRGFWHTLVSAVLVFFVVYKLTGIKARVPIPLENMNITFGVIFTYLLSYACFHLASVSLFLPFTKRSQNKSGVGKLRVVGVIILLTVMTVFSPITKLDTRWIAFSVSIGYLFHIIGDTFTTSGAPVLWPIPIKGKAWWNIRISKMKSGGEMEKLVLVPMFTLTIVIAIIKIIYFSTQTILLSGG